MQKRLIVFSRNYVKIIDIKKNRILNLDKYFLRLKDCSFYITVSVLVYDIHFYDNICNDFRNQLTALHILDVDLSYLFNDLDGMLTLKFYTWLLSNNIKNIIFIRVLLLRFHYFPIYIFAKSFFFSRNFK